MRLNKKDIQSIVRVAKEIYEKRGGDIDLLVRTIRKERCLGSYTHDCSAETTFRRAKNRCDRRP